VEIVNFLNDDENKMIIENLLREIKINNYENKIKKTYFVNDNGQQKKVLITGTFEKFSRDELKDILREKGAKIVSSVSKNVDILLAGKNAGSKLEKAEKLNIEILSENELIKKF